MTVKRREPKSSAKGETQAEPKRILLDPEPGDLWAALVGDEAIAYGKTLQEARAKALALRPDEEPEMLRIAWLWDIGFFSEPDEEGNVARAVWI